VNRLVKQYQDMARMMKKMGGKTGAAAMKAMLGGSGMPGGGGGMPDLGALSRGLGSSGLGPSGLGSSGFGKGLGGGLAKGLGSSLANGLPGLGGKPDGKKK
jgi:signal recognition particle subunit SRP54